MHILHGKTVKILAGVVYCRHVGRNNANLTKCKFDHFLHFMGCCTHRFSNFQCQPRLLFAANYQDFGAILLCIVISIITFQ